MADHRAPVVEELVPPPDPARCCELLSDLPYRLFLDSATQGTRLGRYSFLTADPVAVVWSKGARTECIEFHGPNHGTRRGVGGDALDAVRTLLAPHAAEPVPGLPPFQGGAAGYRTRDWVAHPACTERVQVNQAFAWNPSVTGTKVEETCIALADGVEVLTSTSDWPQIPVQVEGREYLSPDIFVL